MITQARVLVIVLVMIVLFFINHETELYASKYTNIEQLYWSNLDKANGPEGLAGQGMVYIRSLKKIMMFGGQDESYRTLNEIWLLDTSTLKWEKVSSNEPAGRADPVLSYVPDDGHGNDIVFLFGGWYNDSLGNVGRLSDTWYYYPADNNWVEIKTTLHPSPRSDSAFAYDPRLNILLMYGGYNGSYLSDLWVYSFANSSWLKVTPHSALSPPPLADSRMEYDKRNDIFVMFGGNNDFNKTKGFNHYSSTWAFNISSLTWINMTPPYSPPARDYAFFAYDDNMGIFLLYAGYGEGVALDDVWVYSFTANKWVRLNTINTPQARFAGGFAYDPAHRLYFMFGGLVGDDYLGDTWALRYPPDVKVTLMHTPALINTTVKFAISIKNNVTSIEEYKWYFNDGSTSSGTGPIHRFGRDGIYDISISIRDQLGQEFTYTFPVLIEQQSTIVIVNVTLLFIFLIFVLLVALRAMAIMSKKV